jgi:hypothetical protein
MKLFDPDFFPPKKIASVGNFTLGKLTEQRMGERAGFRFKSGPGCS